uniref:Progestin and adipoQ receptor family member 8 n=1 Tax=Labrus bergylta TaxID=56723 RepID=A0A3Q3GBI3_9LABR
EASALLQRHTSTHHSAGPPPPSLPSTIRDVDAPPLFRERFILSGYRPVGLSWRCYLLSLFQIHNETVNVWSHLLAAVFVVMRFMVFIVLQGGVINLNLTFDLAVAHLLQSHSEEAHYSVFFLDYVGMAVYQYGCALALFLYSSDIDWSQSMLGQVFLPAAALLAWFSCTTGCYAKLRFRRPYPLHRKLCQVVPLGVAYLLDISPVADRLLTHRWTSNPALPLHFLQVVTLFLSSAFFFSFPIPESFSPGRYDILGHSHQLFHILLSVCTLVQQEALFEDFLWRRPALLRRFGEERLLLACLSFPCLTLCCTMTALFMRRRAQAQLMKEQR